MTSSATCEISAVPSAIMSAVTASVDNTYSAFFSEKPVLVPYGHGEHHGPCIAGIISFLGNDSFSLAWVLTSETAPALARKFAGFDIPFDSTDMGDVAGELVNVIAGEIVSQLEKRKIKAQMSLPIIARGSPLELVPQEGPSIAYLEYTSKEGMFWFRVEAKHQCTRMPGR